MSRANTRVVKIGDRVIGGGNPILIQSMTNTKTEDVEATVKQIQALTEAGCDIIRCAVPTMEAAKALSEIKKQISIPLVADIHFDYRLAIAAIENGADKIRINPGNIRRFACRHGLDHHITDGCCFRWTGYHRNSYRIGSKLVQQIIPATSANHVQCFNRTGRK